MNRNLFSNPAFRVSREPEGLQISLPVKPESFRTLLNFVWLLVWAAGEAALVLFILGALRSVPSVSLPLAALGLAVFTAAGGVVLWRSLWGVGGRETFVVSQDALSVRREICGIGHSRKFEFERIRSVKPGRLKYRVIYPSWGRMFIGHDGSEIVIDCAGRTYAYGKGLEESEARSLVDLLQEEMAFQFHKLGLPGGRLAYIPRSGMIN